MFVNIFIYELPPDCPLAGRVRAHDRLPHHGDPRSQPRNGNARRRWHGHVNQLRGICTTSALCVSKCLAVKDQQVTHTHRHRRRCGRGTDDAAGGRVRFLCGSQPVCTFLCAPNGTSTPVGRFPSRQSSGVAPRACVRVYARVLRVNLNPNSPPVPPRWWAGFSTAGEAL